MKKYQRGKIKCYNKKTKEIIFLEKNSSLLYNKNIIKSGKFQLVVKDLKGNKFTVFKDDPRLLSNEIFPANIKHFINCSIHGKQKIENQKRIKAAAISEKYKIYCPKCRKFYLSKDYIHSNKNINECKNSLNLIYFVSSNQQTEGYFKKYMPHFFKVINNFQLENLELRFSDKIYFLKNNITKIPKCKLNKCSNKVDLLKCPSYFGFTIYCKKHKFHNFSNKEEENLANFIKKNYKGKILRNYRKFNNKELDIYIPEKSIAFEFNGLYWHSDIYHKDKNYHKNKFIYFKNEGIKLITIWEDDWRDKKDLIKSIILNQLNKTPKKINARDCKTKIIKFKEKKDFLENNHIQGNCVSSINLGLFYNNKLVSAMTFGKNRKILGQKTKKDNYELLRFCSQQKNSVRGGASKLFKYFINNFKPQKIISYANLNLSNGNLYKILNFNNKGFTVPNYWWSNGKNKFHRSNFMKHKLVKEGANPNKTADEIMRKKGYYKIWGLGNLKYEWTTKEKV